MRATHTILESVRRVAGHPRIVPGTALLLRARTVRGSAAFIAREVGRRSSRHTYRLRENGLQAVIRHGTGDVVTLGEVFHQHDYAVPVEVATNLGEPARIVDLGANIGLFSVYAAGCWPAAQIEAFEPDPANADVLCAAIAANGLDGRIHVVRAAAGSANGTARFASGGVALSALDATGDILVEVRDVLQLIAGADLVKLDIEGGEWAILADPRFTAAPPRALVMEYHPGGDCPDPDPHRAIVELLAAAGLRTQEIWRRDEGYGMLWAWQA